MTVSVLGIYVADLVFFGKKIPDAGETILGKNFIIGPGGKGSNQAVAASKAGAKTFFISKIGNDQFGSMAIKIYKESKVDFSHVKISKEYSTGAAGILVNEDTGSNAINVYPGAGSKISIEDIDKADDIIKNSNVFLTQLEAPIKTVYYALKKANNYGVKTILNPAPARNIDNDIFPLIDYFTPNETEASYYVNYPVITYKDAEKAAEQLLDKGIKNIIITLGDKGAYFANYKEKFSFPSAKFNDQVVDTTGAGDAFNAGFAVAITENMEIKKAISFANATAGLSTTKIGTANSMPNRDEIEKILK